jgi:hypothetical protein
LLVCNWPHYVGQNHLFVKMLLNRDSAIQSASRRFCVVYKLEKLDPLQLSRRSDILSKRPTVQSIIRPDDKNFPFEPSSVSRSFELFQLVSVQTFQQYVRKTLSVQLAMGFLSKTLIWEVRCNRPDALIHKTSIVSKIQTLGRQSSWSRRASIRYGNCVHQIKPSGRPFPWSGLAKRWYGNLVQRKCDRPDDRAPPSGRSSNHERISTKFWKADRTVFRPNGA